jgi:hypothetical protein
MQLADSRRSTVYVQCITPITLYQKTHKHDGQPTNGIFLIIDHTALAHRMTHPATSQWTTNDTDEATDHKQVNHSTSVLLNS